MKKKLIFIDLDGTTLDTRKTIHPYNIKVLKKAQEVGHQAVIATGRPWRSSKEYYQLLGLNTPVCNYNGSHIHHPLDPTFPSQTISIPFQLIFDLEEKMGQYIDNIMCEEEDKVFLLKEDEKLNGFFWRDSIEVIVGPMKKMLTVEPTTVIIGTRDPEYNDVMVRFIEENYPTYICRFWGGTYDSFAEIYPTTINKGIAAAYITDHLKMKQEDTIAYGDAPNDTELLAYAHIGVAMKNGSEIVLKTANEITLLNHDEGGLGDHLNRLLDLHVSKED